MLKSDSILVSRLYILTIWFEKKLDCSFYTTLKSAAAASSRNGTRIYLILLCHFMTQNQMLRCKDATAQFLLGHSVQVINFQTDSGGTIQRFEESNTIEIFKHFFGLGHSQYPCDQNHKKIGPNQTFLLELRGFKVGRGGINEPPV